MNEYIVIITQLDYSEFSLTFKLKKDALAYINALNKAITEYEYALIKREFNEDGYIIAEKQL